MKTRYLLPLIALTLWLGGCATATLMNRTDGSVDIVGSGYDEDEALEAALDKGIAYCKVQGKSFAVINRQSRYQGIDPNMKAAINVAGIIAQKPIYGAGNRSDDWRVDMQGKCQ